MVTLGPRESSLRSGSTALGDNPNPEIEVSDVKMPAGIAAAVAQQSDDRDPLDDVYRGATPVFDVPVSRAIGATSPHGLYRQGQLPCEFLLFCNGSVGCYPRAAAGGATGGLGRLGRTGAARWPSLDVRPPWTRKEFEDFDEWLVAMMVGEAEAGYINDAMYPLPGSTLTVDYRPPSPEPSC